jgi:hypothetical protein
MVQTTELCTFLTLDEWYVNARSFLLRMYVLLFGAFYVGTLRQDDQAMESL